MRKMTKKLRLILIMGMITLPAFLMAQPRPDTLTDPGGGGGAPPGDTNDVPFDGGVSLLVAAGVAYGLKKVHEKKKAEKDIKL